MFFKRSKQKCGFHTRMTATIIDWCLLSIFLSPIFGILDKYLYGPNHPRYVMEKVFQNTEGKFHRFSEFFIYLFENDQLKQFLFEENGLNKILISLLVQSLFYIALFLAFWNIKQATPGKMLMRLKIVDFKTGEKPTRRQYVIRFFGYIISFLPLFLGYLWVIVDKNKRSLHDYLSGTKVVRVEKKISS